MNYSSRTRGDRGSVIPLVALGMVMMLTMAAFAIDLGSARQAKAQVQSTTDAAALAGAQSLKTTGNGPDGMKKAIYDAADWAFRNLNMTVPTPTTNCGANKTCYNKGDAANTVVEITTPYTPSRIPTDTWSDTDFIHVRTCYNNATYIAGVIGISSIRVCSDATARMVGTFNPNSDFQDNDPFALCTTNPTTRLFDTGHWFPTQNPPKDIPGNKNFGGTYLYTSDSALGRPSITDPSAVQFVIGAANPFKLGGNFPDGQANLATHVLNANSPYASIAYKNQDAQNRYKWEFKFRNWTNLDSNGNGKDERNFDQTLPDGQYTFSIYVRAANGDCDQESWTVFIGAVTNPALTGLCQEDLFRGGTQPSSGSKVTPGQTVTATYYDETRPWRPSVPVSQGGGGFETDPTKWGTDLQFSMTGPDPSPDPQKHGKDKTWDIVKNGQLGDISDLTGAVFTMGAGGAGTSNGTGAANAGGSGEYKWIQRYQFTLPTNLIDGAKYTLEITSYDSDQNKAGGDCGKAKWTVAYTNGKGQILLWD